MNQSEGGHHLSSLNGSLDQSDMSRTALALSIVKLKTTHVVSRSSSLTCIVWCRRVPSVDSGWNLCVNEIKGCSDWHQQLCWPVHRRSFTNCFSLVCLLCLETMNASVALLIPHPREARIGWMCQKQYRSDVRTRWAWKLTTHVMYPGLCLSVYQQTTFICLQISFTQFLRSITN